jgi:hypothetical protein
MQHSICVGCGRVYRGEILHKVALGCVVIFPSWLTPRRADGALVEGGRATFNSPVEAMLFVDAHFLMVERALLSCSKFTMAEA